MPKLAETAAFSHLSAKRQLLRQFRQGLFAPDRGKRHFRLESRAVVPARSSRHAISCFRHLSQTQAGIPLIRAVQIPEAALSIIHVCSLPSYPVAGMIIHVAVATAQLRA